MPLPPSMIRCLTHRGGSSSTAPTAPTAKSWTITSTPAVNSLAAHDVYLSVLDPDTPVREQARKVVDMTTLPPLPGFEGHRSVEFILKREADD